MASEGYGEPAGFGHLSREEFLRRSALVGAALMLPGALASTASASSSSAAAKRGGRLRVAIPGAGAKEQMHPFNGTTPADVARRFQIFDPLFRQQGAAADYRPYLAESVEPNKTGKVWKITLRSGVEDHRGRTLTAADAIWSLRKVDVKYGGQGSPFSSYMNLKTGLKRTGKYTFEMHLDQALGDLASIARDTSSTVAPMNWNSDPKHPVGTGPFQFVSFTPGQRSLFKRNPNYWGSPAYLEELELITIADGTARANALTSGQVDAVESFDFLQAKNIRNNPKTKLLNAKSEWTIPFMTRFDMDPFEDKRGRLAAKLSVDRPALVKTAFFGFGTIGNDEFGKNGPSTYYNSSLPQRHYDPEQAKFLLKQAGYPDGIDVEMNLAPTCGCQGPEGVVVTAAQAWQQQAKAAGIRFTIKQITNLDQFSIIKFPFSATWWSPGVPFVYNWFTDAKTSGATYNEGWDRPAWDKRYRKALAEQDPARRKALWNQLQAEFHADGGHVIWGHYNLIDGLSRKVQGAYSNSWPLSSYDFKRYWLA